MSVRVALRYGIFMAISLIAYFLIVRLFDLHENPWLRLLNGVVMVAGISLAIKHYKLIDAEGLSYINGIKIGILTGFTATIIFTIFMAIYMFHIDPEFTQTILEDWLRNYDSGAGVLVFIIFLEGMGSSVVLSLALMQFFKKSYQKQQKK
ncbi:DUF4199 family protein [Subsaximicrobium wynnwilliamsii]|uniref:DUF4199 family protein n=2 Tax=Subsaximicrobium wynnwilliamsii TaxID=291179 RepID=A0A5C6ZH79_9FLAO|nr:DUF4199 family protein [Subsaximicrobium wynnwilliamsii]TXD89501.1 DUF4199 family protein [Subsaximicrobium wynnwilliamsii]TXE03623.1 DUF4199 family protein [Subsaximicrobium wynnwilliamsii]